ncbi:MAG TPA: hypothetical protein VHI52_19730, partial [Verrucomicrobiae bacterium]|nr:hypothetical protein [Verrucomicrobiae bacterium]
MIFRKQPVAGLTLALLATAFSGHSASAFPLGKKAAQELPAARLTASQSQLVDKAINREKEVIKVLKERAPLVETYIQNMRPDNQLVQAPESDQHFLGRVEFGRIIGGEQFDVNEAT